MVAIICICKIEKKSICKIEKKSICKIEEKNEKKKK